ncbi:MAG: methanol oxidation system protein MoxJ [Candidatus Methylomirabilis oxygeniifera]|nr:MAG: methanol oxidation system protein MoxJ [Candidatus Methylomirabilis oxyfera]
MRRGLALLFATITVGPAGWLASSPPAGADQTTAISAPLKVCSAADELPYSNEKLEGFENRIAVVIGEELRRPIEHVWWKDPRFYIRDLLEAGACDITIGIDAGNPRVLSSQPYYRSGYVFIYRKDKGISISDWNSPILKTATIAVVPGTPAETMLKQIDRYYELFNYLMSLVDYKSRRNQYVKYDPARLVQEVISGRADVAVLWGPSAARYVRQSSIPLEMVMIPDRATRTDGEPVPHHYDTSLGVRKEDQGLLNQLNDALVRRRGEIETILKAEGIPALPLTSNRLTAAEGGVAQR